MCQLPQATGHLARLQDAPIGGGAEYLSSDGLKDELLESKHHSPPAVLFRDVAIYI